MTINTSSSFIRETKMARATTIVYQTLAVDQSFVSGSVFLALTGSQLVNREPNLIDIHQKGGKIIHVNTSSR